MAVRYAKALYGYAIQKGVAKDIYAISACVLDSFAQNRSLEKTIEDPLLDKGEKLSLMMASAGLSNEQISKENHEVAEKFFRLLVANKRENYLVQAMRYYQLLYRKENNIGVAKITTAVPLDKDMEERIYTRAASILGKEIELEKIVDPKIIGGFILDVDDYRIDASALSEVNKIRRIV